MTGCIHAQRHHPAVAGVRNVSWPQQRRGTNRLTSAIQCPAIRSVTADYGNATSAGLPACLLNRLQSVLDATARSIAGLRRSDHITSHLASFHWLRAPKGIEFTLPVIVYRVLHGTAPRYLSNQL